MGDQPAGAPQNRRSRLKRVALCGAVVVLGYLAVSYLLMPAFWFRYAHRHPALENLPGITHTADGMPGDPVNVALVGTKPDVMRVMVAARWYPADALSLRSCLEIAEASVLKRPYDAAPVSNLFLFGRKEDLAFEQPVGDDPRQRHHVRFWQTDLVGADGRPIWAGSAVYDDRVGVSRLTGEVTHHTAADVDAERDYLFADLQRTGDLAEKIVVEGFHKQREGRNGGGDPWRTDGNLYLGVIAVKGPS